ncbi:hypothetical protein EMPG_16044 [Blastomyces silverae]|uniref:Uncharacterized protein n=1 Tax=Blastomyces silverae TaxID=2060906 RepID=A0A0H1BH44_9EURO|nr:hypothetical protein EMPG_16044 [Blastomyces silverae]
MCPDDNKIMTVFGDNPTGSKTQSGAGAQLLSEDFDNSYFNKPYSGLRAPDSGLATYSDGTD